MKFDVGTVHARKSSRLPHWDVQHGIYFITFNLFDAVPVQVRAQIEEEVRAQIGRIEFLRGQLTIAEKRAIDAWVRRRIGRTLDESGGQCFLKDHRVGRMVEETLTLFDQGRYHLLCWCVMPNHVHVVCTLSDALERVVHSWKSFTAKAANRLLGRTGSFWQEGYYDRCIRNSGELTRTIEYVLGNPEKAGLSDWPFVKAYPERVASLLSPGGAPGEGERGARPPT